MTILIFTISLLVKYDSSQNLTFSTGCITPRTFRLDRRNATVLPVSRHTVSGATLIYADGPRISLCHPSITSLPYNLGYHFVLFFESIHMT
jgi:hypothetical protein